jgi:hypothetical protein
MSWTRQSEQLALDPLVTTKGPCSSARGSALWGHLLWRPCEGEQLDGWAA